MPDHRLTEQTFGERMVPESQYWRMERQRDHARDLLARAVRMERWVSIGTIHSHVALSPITREIWDEVVEELKR